MTIPLLLHGLLACPGNLGAFWGVLSLQELHRVLRPGATVAILDFNNVQNPVVDAFQVWPACAAARKVLNQHSWEGGRGVRPALFRGSWAAWAPQQGQQHLTYWHRRMQGFMLESVVVPAARDLGVAEEYEYLRPSIKRFPPGVAPQRGWLVG